MQQTIDTDVSPDMMLESHLKQLKSSKDTDRTIWNHLIEHHYAEFPQWWDPDKFVWDDILCAELCSYCSKYFDLWFDPELFNYKDLASVNLCKYCAEHFDKWWNPEKFNWLAVNYLSYVPNKFDKWIKDVLARKEAYNRMLSNLAVHFPDKFDVWWKPELVQELPLYSFLVRLPDKFDIWIEAKAKVRRLDLSDIELLTRNYKDRMDQWLDLLERFDIDPADLLKIFSELAPELVNKWLPLICKRIPPLMNALKNVDSGTLEQLTLQFLLEN